MATGFNFEYVTAAVSMLKGDGIVVHVLNDSKTKGKARAVIYMNTGAGATLATDSGSVDVVASWNWGLGFTVSKSGEYWVRIQVSSEFLIPKASFERLQNSIWVPVVSYLPSEFATFRLRPVRKRIWSD